MCSALIQDKKKTALICKVLWYFAKLLRQKNAPCGSFNSVNLSHRRYLILNLIFLKGLIWQNLYRRSRGADIIRILYRDEGGCDRMAHTLTHCNISHQEAGSA